MEEVYYDSVSISYKTLNIFESIYQKKKDDIIEIIRKSIKEKYNIDIITNGPKGDIHNSTNNTNIDD